MNGLKALTKQKAPEQSRTIFEGIEKAVGMLPNIYAVIGNSANALSSYLEFSEKQKNGSFNEKEREAIFLAVSEENGCNYCLAAHTAIAKMNGFTEEETISLRAGTYNDKKLSVLINLAKSIISNRGKADESLINAFYEAGFDQQALVDLVALVIDKTFSNYIGRLAQPEIDFPKVESLQKEVAA
ncbi:MAG: carboxymuconolactone decarboxylase family protein [Melioribacteraceae bacterium]|nr:carboxymuconolactone decarboxylase family protein [Melioribacteraceae bacterium]